MLSLPHSEVQQRPLELLRLRAINRESHWKQPMITQSFTTWSNAPLVTSVNLWEAAFLWNPMKATKRPIGYWKKDLVKYLRQPLLSSMNNEGSAHQEWRRTTLQKFSVTTCKNTLYEIGYLNKIENPNSLQRVVDVADDITFNKLRQIAFDDIANSWSQRLEHLHTNNRRHQRQSEEQEQGFDKQWDRKEFRFCNLCWRGAQQWECQWWCKCSYKRNRIKEGHAQVFHVPRKKLVNPLR